MPKAIHDKLIKQAMEAGLKGERRDAYVYGTLNKIEEKKGKKRGKKAKRNK